MIDTWYASAGTLSLSCPGPYCSHRYRGMLWAGRRGGGKSGRAARSEATHCGYETVQGDTANCLRGESLTVSHLSSGSIV